MPTFRENGFSAFPLDFKTLNKSMEEQNIKFYVKLHPYVLSKYRDTIKEQTFSNIIFYNTAGDIYPILKYIDILITDYSSIAYDFLLLNKPIIFFNYDYIEYKQAREASAEKEFLLDYEKDTPGQKVQTQIELINEMAKILEGNDLYSEARIEIRNKLFDYTDGNSCSRIYNHIKTNTQGE
jgi:CDP-glycerol glycerophosphotransferase (TagB/SpsB family)